MSNGPGSAGIYDDTNNKWATKYTALGAVELCHSGNIKLATSSTGVTITGTASATTFSGALDGNADTATTAATCTTAVDNSSNATRYLTFVNLGTAANQVLKTDTSISYNPSTNILSTTASQIRTTADSTNATRYLTFVDSGTTGNRVLKTDTGISYNPSTNTLTTTLNGSATSAGTATTATTATGLAGPIFYAYNNTAANGPDVQFVTGGVQTETRLSYYLTDTTVNLGSRYFTTGTNRGRFVASTAGTYVFGGSSLFKASSDSGAGVLHLKKNGTTYQPALDDNHIVFSDYIELSGGNQTVKLVNTYLQLDANDYIELLVFGGSSGSVSLASTNGFSCFSGYRIS